MSCSLSVGHFELCHDDIRGIHLGAPIISDFKRKRQWNLASGFCILEPPPMHTGINRRQVHPLIQIFALEPSGWMRLISTKPFICLEAVLVGVTVRTEVSMSSPSPPRVLSPLPNWTQSWRPCFPGLPRASGWRRANLPVLRPRGGMIGSSARAVARDHALPRFLSSRRCMRSWWIRGRPLFRLEAARLLPPSSLPSMAGRLGGTLTFPRWRVLETSSSPVQSL